MQPALQLWHAHCLYWQAVLRAFIPSNGTRSNLQSQWVNKWQNNVQRRRSELTKSRDQTRLGSTQITKIKISMPTKTSTLDSPVSAVIRRRNFSLISVRFLVTSSAFSSFVDSIRCRPKTKDSNININTCENKSRLPRCRSAQIHAGMKRVVVFKSSRF